jgi:flagellar basal body-associated protein FliL
VKKLLGNKRILAIPVVLLVVLGVAYKMFLAPKPKSEVKKVHGTLVALGEPFTLNLAGGHYGRLSVSLIMGEGGAASHAAASTTAPAIPQADLVRSIITDNLTGIDQSRLIDRRARHDLLAQLVRDLKKSTDEPVKEVLITDLAVQ